MPEETLSFQIINTKQGTNKNLLFFKVDKCLYKKNKVKENIIYYKCIGKCAKNEACAVTGKLQNNTFSIVKRTSKHNHMDHSERAEAQQVYNKMKKEIKISTKTVGEIMTKNLEKY